MNKSLEFKTFVSNYVPELGYLTDEEIEFLPIDHALAEVAAQKILDYEENEVTYGHQSILSKQNETDDLLETWGDLSDIVTNQADDHNYRITLIGYPLEVFVLKKDGQFYFESMKEICW